LLGAPFIVLMALGDSLFMVYVGLAIFGLFRGMYDSNIYASLFSVVQMDKRASVAAAMIMFAYIIGSLAPLVLGVIKLIIGLAQGLSLLSVFYICGGILILWASIFNFRKDRVKE